MPEFKERPKMDSPKVKPSGQLSNKQAAKVLRDKYVKQLDQRSERPERPENETAYATDRVEGAGRFVTDEAVSHAPRPYRRNRNAPKERPKAKEEPEAAQAGTPKPDPKRPKERPTTRPKEKEPVKLKTSENAKPRQPANTPKARKAPVVKERTTEGKAADTKTGTGNQAVPRAADKKAMLEKSRRGQTSSREVPTSLTDRTPTPAKPNRPAKAPAPSSGFKERTRSAIKTRPSVATNKPKSLTLKSGRPAIRGAKKAARDTVQKQMTQRMMAQARRAAKATANAAKKAAEAAVRAVVSLISSLVGLLGGGVLIAILLLVAIVAAIASSPFGIFFAGGGSDGSGSSRPTISVAEAVGQINMDYNDKLATLQAGSYDSIDVTGAAPEWPDVLAVFGSRYAAADDGVDVATLDADRVDKLKATFWDMCQVTSYVQTISHPGTTQEDGTTTGGWTERILHITITPKTAEEMGLAYGFNNYQTEAMNEMLSDRAALTLLAGLPVPPS